VKKHYTEKPLIQLPTSTPPRDRAEEHLRARQLARGDLDARFYDRDGQLLVTISRKADTTFILTRPASGDDLERFAPEFRAYQEAR
jgi:hypothetical protein